MTTTRRKNFLYRLSLTGIFLAVAIASYQRQSDIWWVWGIVTLIMGIDALRFGMDTARQGEWEQEYKAETHSTQGNSYLAGYWAFWVTIVLLVGGVTLDMLGILGVSPIALMSSIALVGLFAFVMCRVFFNTRR